MLRSTGTPYKLQCTATDCAPEVHVSAELHAHTEMVSATVPGFMLIVIWLALTMVGERMLVVHCKVPVPLVQ